MAKKIYFCAAYGSKAVAKLKFQRCHSGNVTIEDGVSETIYAED